MPDMLIIGHTGMLITGHTGRANCWSHRVFYLSVIPGVLIIGHTGGANYWSYRMCC